MKRLFPFCPSVLVAVLTLVSAFLSAARGTAADAFGPGQPAPAWQLKDLDGKPVSSEAFKGKVVVVDFWATWCGPCVSEIPGYVALAKKYGPEGLAIVGVSLDRAGPARVKEFVRQHGMNYTVVMGDDSIVETFGGFDAIPTTFLIDRSGRIVHRKTGSMAHDAYEKLVKQALE
jgi:thiol-disulfide isomerase/thioredoxin